MSPTSLSLIFPSLAPPPGYSLGLFSIIMENASGKHRCLRSLEIQIHLLDHVWEGGQIRVRLMWGWPGAQRAHKSCWFPEVRSPLGSQVWGPPVARRLNHIKQWSQRFCKWMLLVLYTLEGIYCPCLLFLFMGLSVHLCIGLFLIFFHIFLFLCPSSSSSLSSYSCLFPLSFSLVSFPLDPSFLLVFSFPLLTARKDPYCLRI